MNGLSIAVAFVAGLVSFLSPCILPIIPGFLAYLAGASLADGEPRPDANNISVGASRKDIFLASVFFVLGFSAVFSLLGVFVTSILGIATYVVRTWLARIGGGIMILFGLYLTGLLHIPFLEREYKVRVMTRFRSRWITSFVFGAAFAAGWTPCVGAVLGGILGLAASAPGSAFTLLFVYSLGLGMPFLLVGIFASRASGLIQRCSRFLIYVQIVFGIVLVAIGILAFTENLPLIANLGLLNRFLLR